MNYVYDAQRRLASAATSGWTQTFGYDGFGNLTAKSVPAGLAEPALPGVDTPTNRVSGFGCDSNGNTTFDGPRLLYYDVENRLTKVTSAGVSEYYAYDEANRRVEKNDGPKVGGNVYDNDTMYFYGPGGKVLSTVVFSWATNGTYTAQQTNRVYFAGMRLDTTYSPDSANIPDRVGSNFSTYPYGTHIGAPSSTDDQQDFATYTKDQFTGFIMRISGISRRGLDGFLRQIHWQVALARKLLEVGTAIRIALGIS